MTRTSQIQGRAPNKLSRRRMFALLGAAVAAAAAGKVLVTADPPKASRSTWKGKTRWIGHC